MIRARLSLIGSDRRGAAMTEFALVVVPLLLLLMAGVDFGYQAYVRAVTLGSIETLTRMVTIQNASETDATAAMEAQIKRVAPNARINTVRGSFDGFGSIDALEPLTRDVNNNGQLDGPVDTNGDGIPDTSDCWKDVDNNNVRNVAAVGDNDMGGADDVVRYTVTVRYGRLLPIWRFLNISDTAVVGGSTMVRRQPFESQRPAPIRCL